MDPDTGPLASLFKDKKTKEHTIYAYLCIDVSGVLPRTIKFQVKLDDVKPTCLHQLLSRVDNQNALIFRHGDLLLQ